MWLRDWKLGKTVGYEGVLNRIWKTGVFQFKKYLNKT